MNNQTPISKPADSEQRSGKGLSVQRLVRCDCCGAMFNLDDLNTVDVDKYGEHSTLEVCDDCKTDPEPVDTFTDPDGSLDFGGMDGEGW